MAEPQTSKPLVRAIELCDGFLEVLRDLLVIASIDFMARWTNNAFLDVLALVIYGAIFTKYSGKIVLVLLPRVFAAERPRSQKLAVMFAAFAVVTFTLSFARDALVSQLTKAGVELAMLTR